MKTSTWIIIGVLILVLMIGIGIWAARANAAPVIVPTTPGAPIPPSQTDIIGSLRNFFTNLFGKKPLPPYVQVEPIDADGCDALGYNRIGVRCDTGF